VIKRTLHLNKIQDFICSFGDQAKTIGAAETRKRLSPLKLKTPGGVGHIALRKWVNKDSVAADSSGEDVNDHLDQEGREAIVRTYDGKCKSQIESDQSLGRTNTPVMI
jgi:hypothetical protein